MSDIKILTKDEDCLPCPFCGKDGKVYAENNVGCIDWQCGANIDYGHWCGTENGIPAVHHVIKGWNTRAANLDLEQANVKIKLLEAQIIFVEKTSIAKQVQADKDIKELSEALSEAGKWLTETDSKYYVRGNCLKDIANKYKDK